MEIGFPPARGGVLPSARPLQPGQVIRVEVLARDGSRFLVRLAGGEPRWAVFQGEFIFQDNFLAQVIGEQDGMLRLKIRSKDGSGAGLDWHGVVEQELSRHGLPFSGSLLDWVLSLPYEERQVAIAAWCRLKGAFQEESGESRRALLDILKERDLPRLAKLEEKHPGYSIVSMALPWQGKTARLYISRYNFGYGNDQGPIVVALHLKGLPWGEVWAGIEFWGGALTVNLAAEDQAFKRLLDQEIKILENSLRAGGYGTVVARVRESIPTSILDLLPPTGNLDLSV